MRGNLQFLLRDWGDAQSQLTFNIKTGIWECMDFFFAPAAMLNKHVAAPSANSASFPCQMHFVSVCEPLESKSVPFPLLGMTRNLQFRLRDGGCLRLSNKSWCSSTSKLGSGNVSYSPQSAFGSGAMKPRTWGLHCTGDTT